jgi:hypothetical protein
VGDTVDDSARAVINGVAGDITADMFCDATG